MVNKAFQWHVTCRTLAAAEALVNAAKYVYHDSEGYDHPVSFAPLGRSVVRFQILWVPAHVPDLAVQEIVEEIIGFDGKINVCTRDFLRGAGSTGPASM